MKKSEIKGKLAFILADWKGSNKSREERLYVYKDEISAMLAYLKEHPDSTDKESMLSNINTTSKMCISLMATIKAYKRVAEDIQDVINDIEQG